MEKKTRVLLIGGHGFIGSGLCRELKRRNVAYRSIDIFDLDLTDNNNIDSLSKIIGRYTNVVLLAANVGRKLFDADKGNRGASSYETFLCGEEARRLYILLLI